MRILTWNINSVRLRLPLLNELITKAQPDIFCLQETKVADGLFPLKAIEEMGYPHIQMRGIKSYNGVCICAKMPFKDAFSLNFVEKQDARHLSIQLENRLEIHNFYVPAGGDEPDPAVNPKYDHKLKFLEEAKIWFTENRTPDDPLILLGDLNIAPYEHDVWSSKQLRNVVSHTEPEITRLAALQQSVGFDDLMRKFVSMDQKLYSWWSYRGKNWEKSDRGRRLDHIWGTNALSKKAYNMEILKSFRSAERPSDHAPVVVDFKL